MTVGIDAVGSNSGNGTVATHTLAVAAGTTVFVGVHFQGAPTPSSPTFGGAAMTLVDTANDVYVYRYNNTTGGSKQASVTRSDSGDWAIGVVSMTGVENSNPIGTPVTDAADETSPSEITGISSGDAEWMILDFMLMAADAAMAVGAGQTQRINLTAYNTGFLNFGASTRPGSASALAMGWSTTGTIFGVGHVAVPVRPAATSSFTLPVDHAQAVFQGQSIGLGVTLPAQMEQAAFQGQEVGLLTEESFVLPVLHAAAPFEGQQIPFVYSAPSEAPEAVWEGQEIYVILRTVFGYVNAAWQGQEVGLNLAAGFLLPVTHAQAVGEQTIIDLTVTGLAAPTADPTWVRTSGPVWKSTWTKVG